MKKKNKKTNDIRRILLVEDNHLNLRIMSRLLQNMDIDVVEASSGSESLKYAIEEEFSMIFICTFMPESVGYESAKKIREHSVINKDVPIIAVSSFGYKKTTDKMVEYGINDVISKPLKEDDVNKLFRIYIVEKTTMDYNMFDRKEFESFYNDDILKKDILGTFISERESDINRINSAFQSKNIDMIYDALHYMKSTFTYLKANKILELTQQILNLLVAKKLSDALLLEKTFNQEFDTLFKELSFYIREFD